MPRRAIDGWLPYLDDVTALWTELGSDFKVGDMTLAQLQTLRDNMQTTLNHLNALGAQIGLEAGARDHEISEIEHFAVQFRSAVIAKFGANSPQVNRVPKVDNRRKSSTPTPPPPPPQA